MLFMMYNYNGDIMRKYLYDYIENIDKKTTYSIVLYFCEKYRSEEELIDKYTIDRYIREDI